MLLDLWLFPQNLQVEFPWCCLILFPSTGIMPLGVFGMAWHCFLFSGFLVLFQSCVLSIATDILKMILNNLSLWVNNRILPDVAIVTVSFNQVYIYV